MPEAPPYPRPAPRRAPLRAAVAAIAALSCWSMGALAEPAAAAPRPWMDSALAPAMRAELAMQAMTMDEKLALLFGYLGAADEKKNHALPALARHQSAGYVPGVPRLGIPPLWETDAGIGVASQAGPQARPATALPSGISAAASWDPRLAYDGGAMIGAEARAYGFNVMLAGGANLMRDPRNGRTFEYGGEDPLLAGRIVGAQIRGIQSNHIVSTLKHFAVNDQESGRTTLDARIDDTAARMSDLLAFQLAHEEGQPGAVMCSYNRVNGVHACENEALLNGVLKRDWGFKGWVMSDWGAVHSTIPAANAGLDQQSGFPFDRADYFRAPLMEATLNGWVAPARLDDMARRVLHAMFANGLVDHPVAPAPGGIDRRAHGAVSLKAAQEGMVLLKNRDALLPLARGLRRIAVIGGHADKGVIAGGGSSLVYPEGGNAVPGVEPLHWPGPVMFYPSSPLQEIRQRAPRATVSFNDGADPAAAARAAAGADVVVLFATQWSAEGMDVPSLSLPGGQDALIAAVTAANPRTVVVLETGGPVTMPWLANSGAVLEAWYPGTSGGAAIAGVLFGEVNPSGRLPVSFPAAEAQLPRPQLDGYPDQGERRFEVDYHEGAAVGYKWFDLKQRTPLFPFGHGLSYTRFRFDSLRVSGKAAQLQARFGVANLGKRAGKQVAQLYVAPLDTQWEAPKRLAGFAKVNVGAGAHADAAVTVDPRLLAVYQPASGDWKVAKGRYRVTLGASARDPDALSAIVDLDEARFDMHGAPLPSAAP